jgi:hypothetical protein
LGLEARACARSGTISAIPVKYQACQATPKFSALST